MAFAQEISHTDLSVLDLELLDDNCDLPPFGPVYDTIASLADLALDLQLLPGYLDIRVEFSMLSDPRYLEFGWSLHLPVLFAGHLALLEERHVESF